MTMKVENDKGEEIEVYTAEEVTAAKTAERVAVEGEYKPKLTAAEAETVRVNDLLKARGDEFKQFRKLNDEQVAKLTAAEKTIYENTLIIQEQKDAETKRNKDARELLVANTIKAKVGTDEKLVKKVSDMYALIGIEANTQEEIDKKVLATLGAIGQTEPDALASVAGFTGGLYTPPVVKKEGNGSFADTEQGKRGAAELGLKLEADKK